MITFGQTKSDNNNWMITITDDFYLVIYTKWDAEMWLHWAADNINQCLHYVAVIVLSVLMENRQDFEASNMGETLKRSLLKQDADENISEDIIKLHNVLCSLKVEMKMPPNGLTYQQVFFH